MPTPSSPIRVLSYNVHHCNPPARPKAIHVEAIASIINHQNPDLVAIQEVDVNTARCGHINQAQLLAEQTGMNLFFAKAIDFSGGEFGNVILSKFPILESQMHPLPSKPELKGEPRVLAMVQVKTGDGFQFVFANTHLDSQGAETNRLLQIEAVCKTLEATKLPVILAGDFNATPDSATIAALDRSFRRANDKAEFTFPATQPKITIDYIAYQSPRLRVRSQEVVAETLASDHRPVLCVFEVI